MRRCAVAILLMIGALLAACTSGGSPAGDPAGEEPSASAVEPVATWPSAAAVQAENSKPGTPDFLAGASEDTTSVEGYLDRASIAPGDDLTLRVRSPRGAVQVNVFRLGWYDGVHARQVWASEPVTTVTQPEPTFDRTTRTVSAANWHPSLTFDTASWPPGFYVVRMTATDGAARVAPLVVRAPTVQGAIVILNANTNTQAYNAWGGYSLYHGPSGSFRDRSYVSSFDRPIDYGLGAGDLLDNEAPLLRLAERLGLPLAYLAGTDLEADPSVVSGAAAVISLGHDEYYSRNMRAALTDARDGGTNLAFLGANAVYRHIRFDDSPIGADRLQVGYKNGDVDPILKTDPAEATYEWRRGPVPRPESDLTGVFYQCNPVKAPMVVADASAWLFEGTGLKNGDKLVDLVGGEYDQVTPSVVTPTPIQVLFHSPVTCRQTAQHADAAYYTTSSGAGVFASGTSSWVCAIEIPCDFAAAGNPRTQQVVSQMTTTLLTEFAKGPTGETHPARDNLSELGITAKSVTDLPVR